MAEEIEIKVKSDISDATKEAAGLASELEFMGVSLNTLKSSFGKIIPSIKKMFRSIKAGIASTGIGLLVIALGSVATYFTSTKEGAEKLEKALKVVGTTIAVITDRLSGLGKIITNVFSKPLGETLKDVKENFKGVTEEIKEEVKVTMKMVDASQKLRDAQRALNVETAKSVADIEKLKLVAEDVTKSYKEREEAAVAAFAREKQLEDARIKLAKENLELIKIDVGLGESLAEDLDRQAEAEIALANIRQEAAGRQISLQNFLNALRLTEQAEKDAAAAEELARIDKEFEAKIAANDKWNEEQQKQLEKEKQAEQDLADFKASLQDQAIAALGANLDASMSEMESNYKKEKELAEAQGRDTTAIDEKYEKKRQRIAAAQKKFKVAEALITTYQMASLAYKDGLEAGGPAGLVLGPLAAGIAAAAGLANVRQILAQDTGGGGGGGVPAASVETPAPSMVGGSFTLGGGVEPEPARAYVVSDDITNNQNKLAIIRRRATI